MATIVSFMLWLGVVAGTTILGGIYMLLRKRERTFWRKFLIIMIANLPVSWLLIMGTFAGTALESVVVGVFPFIILGIIVLITTDKDKTDAS